MASHVRLPTDEGNDDKELIAIYDDLLQYFIPFGYSRHQLVEAIKEANVGPQLNDFNVNRLFEFLSFQNEVTFEESKTTCKNVENESGEGNSKSLRDQLSSVSIQKPDPTIPDKAQLIECGTDRKASKAPQAKDETLANSFDQMVMQLQILGYSNSEVRQAIMKSNVSPFITDENINKVVEYLENPQQNKKDMNMSACSANCEQDFVINITNTPIAHHTPPQISVAPISDSSTSAKIRASHYKKSLLQDNCVTSSSSLISMPRPVVQSDEFYSLPKHLSSKNEIEDMSLLQDQTVSSTLTIDRKPLPTPLHINDPANDENKPTDIKTNSTARQNDVVVNQFDTVSNMDDLPKTHSLNFPAVRGLKINENKGQSLPIIPSTPDQTDSQPYISDPTVHMIVFDHQPFHAQDETQASDEILHSVSLELHKSQDSDPVSAPNSNAHEVNEADEIEHLRSKVVPFEENTKSGDSSCPESCDADSESIHSYTLLSDPSVIVQELPLDDLPSKGKNGYENHSFLMLHSDEIKSNSSADFVANSNQPVDILSDPFLVSGSLTKDNKIPTGRNPTEIEHGDVKLSEVTQNPETSLDKIKACADIPTTSKETSENTLLREVGFNPFAQGDSMSSNEYSTIDIYNYKGPYDVSSPYSLPSFSKPQSSPVVNKTNENDSSESKTKLVKITPAELRKQLSKEYMKESQEQNFKTSAEEKPMVPLNPIPSSQKESDTKLLSAEFRSLIDRTRLLGYSEERIIEAIVKTNVNPNVNDTSIGTLSDYLDSHEPTEARKSEGSNLTDVNTATTNNFSLEDNLDDVTCTDGTALPPAFVTSTPILQKLDKQPLLEHGIIETPAKAPAPALIPDLPQPKCFESGEPLSFSQSNNNNNGIRSLQYSAFDLATHDNYSSLPATLNRDVSPEKRLQHTLQGTGENTKTPVAKPTSFDPADVTDEPKTPEIVKQIVSCIVDSLPIGEEPIGKLEDNVLETSFQTTCPSDDEVVFSVVSELVDIAVEQEMVLDEVEKSRNLLKEELSDEFGGLITKVQKLGFSRSMVERAIEATNVNPGVGDVSVGVIVDYLEQMSFGSHQSETENEIIEDDTLAEDEVKLLVSEMIAYIVNNESADTTQYMTMDGLNQFIPLYWLAQQEYAEARKKKLAKDPYHELVEKLETYKFKKKAIKAAIEETNVSPAVTEENILCLLEHLRMNTQVADNEGALVGSKEVQELEELVEEIPQIMNTMMVDGYSDMVKYFLEKRYSQLLPAEFKPLVAWIQSHYKKNEWSKSDIKQAILLTHVSPNPCEESFQKVHSFLTQQKPEIDGKVVMVVKLKIEGMMEKTPDVETDVTNFLMNEDFFQECLLGDEGSDRLEVQSTAYGLLKMSDVLPDMLQFVQSYCFLPEEPNAENAEKEPSLKIEDVPKDDSYHMNVLKEVSEEEWDLSRQLRSICDANGKEEDPLKSVPILYKLGRIYRLKSPDKIHLLRSAALFNAALVRIPKDSKLQEMKHEIKEELYEMKHEIKEDLYELCKHVLYLSGGKGSANLLDASEAFFKEVENMRKKSRESLLSLEKVNGKNAFYQEDMDAFKAQLINAEQSHETFERKFDLIGDIVEKAFDPIKSFIEMVELLYEENPDIKAQEEQKIKQMSEIQEGISQDYSYIMRQISDYCVDVLGDPPCKFAQIGMGSLARKEVTPFSDFENAILIENGTEAIKEYFRWYSVIFQMVLINFGETILPCLAIPSLNDFHQAGECWFFDAYSGNGISFDGTMPHACKSPLGWQHGTPNNPGIPKELIQTVGKMAEFVDCKDKTEDFHLSDMLMCTCFVAGSVELYESFQELVKKKVEGMLDESFNDEIFTTLAQDMVKFNGLKSFSNLLLSVKWNVKQVIYRSTTIFIAALGRKHHLQSTSSFEIISELLKKDIIQSHVAHKLKYAIALACEIRLRVYLDKNRQDDWINSDELPLCDLVMLFDWIGVRSTYEYFSIVVYLNMCVSSILEHNEIIPQLPERGLFICLPHLLEYIVHCIDVSFKVGCKMLLGLGNMHLTQLFDEEDEEAMDIEAILKIVKEKIDPENSKQVVAALSEFGNFLTGQGLFVEALICGIVEIYLQMTFLEDQSFNLVKWSRNFIGNMCETLTMLQDNWQTLHWIMEYGQVTDEE
uniref:Uncharacterized protein LOC100184710 n=1 Tax=Phallusia mammillata TaxID=59560 RepID=A0A6F9DIC1_9ASCI|nr:uncharacterized protein LOC100184710 [Phallusia mammillata]